MDSGIVSLSRDVQLIGLAIFVAAIILGGITVFTQGSRGVATVLGLAAAFIIGGWMVIRPNDAGNMFANRLGGVQTPAMITGNAPAAKPAVKAEAPAAAE